jgi:hypothetical protein
MGTSMSCKKAVVCVFLLLAAVSLEVLAQNTGFVRRYAANFTAHGFEIFTNLPPAQDGQGGLIIYNKNFFVADDINTLYVTISATGDDHNGARLQLACLVDGKPCNPGANPVGGPGLRGWHTGLRFKNYNNNYLGVPFAGDGGGGAGDVHDNHVMYTWCTPFETKAGTHNVQVRLASSPGPGEIGGGDVFLEAVHFYIDGARVANEKDRCTNNVVDGKVATEPSTTTAPDGTLIDTTLFVPLVEPSTLTVPPVIQTELP